MVVDLRTRMAKPARGSEQISPLLTFLAGDHARAMARLWPFPHEGFLVLPAARRHAAAMILSGLAADIDMDAAQLRLWLSRARDTAIGRGLKGEEAPGLVRMLSKLGETLWSAADYSQLMALFAETNANRALRHMDEVSPTRFGPMLALPSALREARIMVHVDHIHAARDLAIAYSLALRIRGQRQGASIATRWGRAKSVKALFEKAADGLYPDVFAPQGVALALPAPFTPVRSRKELHALALEFSNCLRDFTDDVARGRMAVYAWRGATHAAVALTWDAAGWRLAEAQGMNNDPLPEACLRQIVDTVVRAGARTGPSLCSLSRRLAAHGSREEYYDKPGDSFTERLELGDLWN